MEKVSKKKHYWLLLIPVFLLSLFLSEMNYLVATSILLVFSFLVLLFFKIELGLYLTAFSLPLIGISFKINFLELPLVDLLALFTLLAFILREIYFYFHDQNRSKLIYPFFSYFLAFFSICLISSLLSSNIIGSLWYAFRWILFFYLAFILVPVNVIKNAKILRNILILFSLSALVLAFFGIYSLYIQDWQDSFFRVRPVPVFRKYIFGDNYNLISEIFLSAGFLILSLKYWFREKRTSRFINILSIFLLLMAWLSFGRTAWLTIALQVIVYSSIYFLIIKGRKIDFKSIILVLFSFLIISSPFIFKMFSLQEANISSTQNRMLLTDIALKAFREKPLVGYGTGSFVHLVANNIRFVSKYGDPLDSHGVWQKLLAENGIIGLLLFALFSLLIFRKLYLGVLENKDDYKLLLPLFVSALGIYFYQFFNTSYYKGRVWLIISLALTALILVEKRNKLKQNESK